MIGGIKKESQQTQYFINLMVVAYLRVSTGKQHLENQQDEISRYAKSKGITVDRWVTEVASGKKQRDNRELGKLLKSLHSGDTLIITEISRLSRTLHEVMAITGRCLERKITIYSTKDGYSFDDSINSKVLSFAFGLVAEIEHKLISQRTREALHHRRSEGIELGRRRGTDVKMRSLCENSKQMIKMIESGVAISDICDHFGVSRDTLRIFRRNNRVIDTAFEQHRKLRIEIYRRQRRADSMMAAKARLALIQS